MQRISWPWSSSTKRKHPKRKRRCDDWILSNSARHQPRVTSSLHPYPLQNQPFKKPWISLFNFEPGLRKISPWSFFTRTGPPRCAMLVWLTPRELMPITPSWLLASKLWMPMSWRRLRLLCKVKLFWPIHPTIGSVSLTWVVTSNSRTSWVKMICKMPMVLALSLLA